MIDRRDIKIIEHQIENATALWKLSRDERRRLIEDGVDVYPGDKSSFIASIEGRADALTGIASTIANGARFPSEHSDVLGRSRIIDDPGIADWLIAHAPAYRTYASYVYAIESLRQSVVKARAKERELEDVRRGSVP